MTDTTTDRIQGVTTSVAIKAPCLAVAITPITLAGLQSVNGVTVAEDDRVLVTAQADTTENGIYDASTGAWSRALDFDGARDAVPGSLVSVYGAADQTDLYELHATAPVRIGTSALTFALRYGANTRYDRTLEEIAAGVVPADYSGANRPAIDVVKRYGMVSGGVTDNKTQLQAAIDAAPDGSTLRITGGTYRISGQILISARNGLTLDLDKTAYLIFDDAAIIGLNIVGSPRSYIRGGVLKSNNTAGTALINLVKLGGSGGSGPSPNSTIVDTEFAYSATDVLITSSYVIRCIGTKHSNSNTAYKTDTSEGANADIIIAFPTFGTSTKGSNAACDFKSNSTQLIGAYFEQQSQTKLAIIVRTGSQRIYLDALLENSGGVELETSIEARAFLRMLDSWDSVSSRAVRIAAGSSMHLVAGSYIRASSLQAGITAISTSSGTLFAPDLEIQRFGTGINSPGVGFIGGYIRNCTTGIILGSGSTAMLDPQLYFDTNTTNVTNNTSGTGSNQPVSFSLNLVGMTTVPTITVRACGNNDEATLHISGATGTSNATTFTTSALPTGFRPAAAVFGSVIMLTDNGVHAVGQCSVGTDGVITFYWNTSASGFTNSGTKGIQSCVVRYRMRNF